ncbi:hypothetical protein N0Y54_31805 [Nostoc punctiforme UO1]|uniref:hypothetical protein n=1 Tax=Nostoc punctiforme TaxID=272131 RepID=UPI0030A5F7C3
MTVELGTEKALVVLGVSQQLLEDKARIKTSRCRTTKKVGRPIQIIADHGSDKNIQK